MRGFGRQARNLGSCACALSIVAPCGVWPPAALIESEDKNGNRTARVSDDDRKPDNLKGIGVHSGAEVEITFHPADADAGIVFQRVLPGGRVSEYRAVSSQVGNTDLCTVLGLSPATSIATIEHVMAAIYALGLDNLLIEVHGAEMPIMDGSSAPSSKRSNRLVSARSRRSAATSVS